MARYLKRDGNSHIPVKTIDRDVIRHRGSDLKPYFTSLEPSEMFISAVQHTEFDIKEYIRDKEHESTAASNTNHSVQASAITAKSKRKPTQPIRTGITETTPLQKTIQRYSGRELWAKSIYYDLDKIDRAVREGAAEWLHCNPRH